MSRSKSARTEFQAFIEIQNIGKSLDKIEREIINITKMMRFEDVLLFRLNNQSLTEISEMLNKLNSIRNNYLPRLLTPNMRVRYGKYNNDICLINRRIKEIDQYLSAWIILLSKIINEQSQIDKMKRRDKAIDDFNDIIMKYGEKLKSLKTLIRINPEDTISKPVQYPPEMMSVLPLLIILWSILRKENIREQHKRLMDSTDKEK